MKRAVPLMEQLLPWFSDVTGSILDFGCALGHVSHLISEKTGRNVTWLDVRRFPFTSPGVTVELYDGKTIPFPSKTYTSSLVMFVLHHTPNPEAALREVVRVTEREVIICEDLLRSKNEFFVEAIKDTIVNYFIPHMTLKYKIDGDWEKMFITMGLKILDKVYFDSRGLFKFRHVAWRLGLM